MSEPSKTIPHVPTAPAWSPDPTREREAWDAAVEFVIRTLWETPEHLRENVMPANIVFGMERDRQYPAVPADAEPTPREQIEALPRYTSGSDDFGHKIIAKDTGSLVLRSDVLAVLRGGAPASGDTK